MLNVEEISDLGLIVTNTLSWNKHIEELSLKANRKLGLIRRLSKDYRDAGIRKILCFSIVRPSLEYKSSLVSAYNQEQNVAGERPKMGYQVYLRISRKYEQ